MKSFDQFQKQRDSALQDTAGKLPAADRDTLLVQALLQRYSKDRPREIVSDVNGNATSDLPLPTAATAAFEDGFSEVTQIEYPTGNVPARYVDGNDWTMYRAPTGLVVRLLAASPAATETIRMTWTARHKDDGSTVPDPDFEAVCDYAAALCYEALAAIYTQTGDATILADSVNYRTKGQEYMSLAKAARKRYFDHIGIQESAAGEPAAGPALATGDMDLPLNAGVDRLTHSRLTR